MRFSSETNSYQVYYIHSSPWDMLTVRNLLYILVNRDWPVSSITFMALEYSVTKGTLDDRYITPMSHRRISSINRTKSQHVNVSRLDLHLSIEVRWWVENGDVDGAAPTGVLYSLRWRHNDQAGVSNHQPRGCLLNRWFRRRSKKTSKLRVTGLCAGNSPEPVNSPHKGPVTRKMFPFDDVIM